MLACKAQGSGNKIEDPVTRSSRLGWFYQFISTEYDMSNNVHTHMQERIGGGEYAWVLVASCNDQQIYVPHFGWLHLQIRDFPYASRVMTLLLRTVSPYHSSMYIIFSLYQQSVRTLVQTSCIVR